jgi:diguanylate cyclase (GGDEF)-like protein
MSDVQRTALDSVLAGVEAVATGKPLERSLGFICEAARALGARDAWVEVFDAEIGGDRLVGGLAPQGPDENGDRIAFEVDNDRNEARFVVLGLSGAALSQVRRLAPAVAMAIQADRLRESIRRTAMRDPLTGLFNRIGLDDLVRRDVERAHRSGARIAIVVLDMDRLDRINQAKGREGGDAAILQVAEILRGGLRMVDVAARIGGGEFCALLPGAGAENAREVAERIRCAIAVTPTPDSGVMTATFGVASLHEHAANGVALLQAAQSAMATGKRRGRNRVDIAVPLSKV